MNFIYKIGSSVRASSLKEEFIIIWKFFYNNVFAYVLLYIQNFLINRFMPSKSLGQFSYNQSMLTLFATVYSMEVYCVYLRFIGTNNEKVLIRTSRRILTIASALFSITIIICFRNPLYILFFGYMWMRERLYFFRSKLDITTYGRIKIFQYIISIAILLLLIQSDNLNEKTLLLGIGVSYCIVSIYYSFNNRAKEKTCLDDNLPKATMSEIVKYALPLSFNAIIVWLLGAADQLLIDKFLDAITLTYYSVAFRVINVIRIGVGVIMEYWPRFYFERMEKRDYSLVKKMYFVFILVVAVLCFTTIVFSKQVYMLLGASKYMSMRWMFGLLALSEFFRQWGAINMTFQSFMKNNMINVACLSVLGFLKLLMNWFCIEDMGVNVLFISTLVCYFAYFIFSLYFGLYRERRHMKGNL